MNFFKSGFAALSLSLILSIAPPVTVAQTAETTSTAVTTESVTTLRSEISKNLEVAEKAKAADPDGAEPAAAAAELLTQAAEKLQARDTATSSSEEHRRAVREAPAVLERVKAELQKDLETSDTVQDVLSTA